jgi:peroxiredoxin
VTARRQWLVVAATVFVAGAAIIIGSRLGRDAQVTVGSRAPDFHAVTIDTVPAARSLADFRGHVTLLNIWATWCGPCAKEMPGLQRLYEEYQSKGLRIAAVSVDMQHMEKDIREFARRYGLTFDVLYDWKQAIARDYMTTGYPETFIIGRDGVIRFHMIGPVDRDSVQLRATITKLLAESGSR